VVGTSYGLYVQPPTWTGGSGTTTLHYGIYVAGTSAVSQTVTTKYALVTSSTAGNVGIGTTSPASSLDIAGGTVRLSNGTSNTIFFGTTGVAAPGNGSAGEKIQLYGTAGTVSSTDYAIGIESGHIWFNTNAGYKWYVNSSVTNIMDSSGNLGLGTTTAGSKLTVTGSGAFSNGTLSVNGGSVSTNGYTNFSSAFSSTMTTTSYQGYAALTIPTQLNGSACGTCLLIGVLSRVDTTGSTSDLLGTSAAFYVTDSAGSANTITNQYGLVIADLTKGKTVNTAISSAVSSGTGKYNIYAGGTAQNYFAGNVGIGSGKSVPAYALEVNGTSAASQFYTSAGYIYTNTGQITAYSNAALTQYCTYVGGSGAWGCISDRRLKENIQPIETDALEKLALLKPSTYNFIENPERSTAGFIAQEIMEVFPDAVTLGENGYYAVNTNYIIPYLVKGTIELNQKVEDNKVEATLGIASISAQLAGVENLTLTTTGNIAIASTPDPLRYEISKNGIGFTQIASLSDLVAANIKAGFVSAEKISTNQLAVVTDQFSINGQSIRDFIIETIQNAGFNNNTNLVAPIASIDKVYTNALSPLPSGNGSITVDGNLAVSGSATISGQLAASSASISGTLAATKVEGEDGIFNGTLRAKNIIADNIEGLSATIATLAAHTVTNITNVYQSGSENQPSIYASEDASHSALLATIGLLDQQNSVSSTSANIGTLIADYATFNQGLLALGPSSFTDVSVAGQFSVGSLYINDNSINTIGSDLQIQPLAQGVIRIMGGKISIDTNGDVQFGENVTIAKNVKVNGKIIGKVISPVPDEDLVIELGTDALPTTSEFKIKNSSGSAVFAVNGAGDITASGSATVAKLNFNLIKPAMATGSGDLISFGSAGVATISATRTEVTIHNSLVTDQSLIYITPVGTPTAQGTYLMRQKAGESFTVGGAAGAVFNWLIIN
jgi:cytoskeletal protein CcmA (bactofilin family)